MILLILLLFIRAVHPPVFPVDHTFPLEQLCAALERHPECNLAHCRLKMIDQRGQEFSDWWGTRSLFARSSPGLLDQDHGAGTWGGWRVYPEQATALAALGSPEHAAKIDEMIDNALARASGFDRLGLTQSLVLRWADEARQQRRFSRQLNAQPGPLARKRYLAGSLLGGDKPAWKHVGANWVRAARWHEAAPELTKGWLTEAGVGPTLVTQVASLSQTAVLG